MFRLTNNISTLKVTVEAFTNNNAICQTVRWKRKPRWVPIAKSKLYKVPPRTVIPQEEDDELKRLHNNYRTQIKSIRRFLTYKHATRLHQTDDREEREQEFLEDFRKCTELNDKWNLEVKMQREDRFQEELNKQLQIAKDRLVERTKINEEKLKEVEVIVREQKELSKTFITPDNIDEAIEKAITNQVDYNFAIDLQGNKIMGRETAPEENNEKIHIKQ